MLLGTLKGILVAVVASIVALAYQTADPPVHVLGRKPGTNVFRPRSKEHPEDETFPGLLMLRLEGRVFFLNAQRIAEKIEPSSTRQSRRSWRLISAACSILSTAALKMLVEGEKRLSEGGVSVWLVGLTRECSP